jgi:hypothetical protein
MHLKRAVFCGIFTLLKTPASFCRQLVDAPVWKQRLKLRLKFGLAELRRVT